MNKNEKKLYESLSQILDIYDEKTDKLKTDDLKISICDYILEGNLLVRYSRIPSTFSYEKELKYDISNFDWDIEYSLSKMCQLYLQGFWTIKYLIKGYESNLNGKYLDLAAEMIKSWLIYEPKSKNKFTWYDHSASDRAKIMIYFILVTKKNNLNKYDNLISEINSSLKNHAAFLYDDNNYTYNNHGTMMDESLYSISIHLNNSSLIKYKTKSLHRLQEAIKRNFSEEMVNLESSTAYHMVNVELFSTIEKILLNPFGDTCGINQSFLEKSTDFIINCTQPDLNVVKIGDSSDFNLKKIANFNFYQYIKDYPPLKWILSSGKSGNEPKDLFKVYKEEGFAFFRNSWDLNKQNEISYVSFISGTSVMRGHKHYDDLSFTLFSKGKDIFVDSGNLNYESGDIRNFLISALAHNSITVDDQSFIVLRKDLLTHWYDNINTGIIDYGEEKEYFYVVGKNDMYDGVNITRSLYYLKSGGIVIFDDIQSRDIHKYSQLFHLNSKINIINVNVELNDKNHTNVNISDENINIYISQLGQCDVNFIKGDKNKIGPGVIESNGFLEDTTSIKFSLKGNNARFVTLINVNDIHQKNNKQCYIQSIPQYGSKEEILIKEFDKEIKIPLFNYSRDIYKNEKHIEVKQKDLNLYSFRITDPDPDEKFAWYILENGNRVDVIWYTSNSILEYLFTKPGNYQIKYFSKKGEKKEKIYNLHQSIIITEEDIVKSNTNIKKLPND